MDSQYGADAFDAGRSKFGLNIVSFLVFVIVVGSFGLAAGLSSLELPMQAGLMGCGTILAILLGLSPRVARQWEKAVVLRLGKYVGTRGPGLFWVIPMVDRVVMWLDSRVRTTGFAAEKTLTSDTVPVNVDAVLFWAVTDPEKAALRVENYCEAVAWAAQTALRDIIGKTDLARTLVGRESIDVQIQELIDARTHDWGISVKSVEIRDIVIPPALEDAMSRQAQAEREKQARIILGDAEVEISQKFAKASEIYKDNNVAFQLRSLNLLSEGLKENTSLMLVPTGLVESPSFGTAASLAALGRRLDGGS